MFALKRNKNLTKSLYMKNKDTMKYLTTYTCENDRKETRQFTSHIFANDAIELEQFIQLRGLGETVDNIIQNTREHFLLVAKSERPSVMFTNKNIPSFAVLHGVVWLCNLNKKIDALSDVGILHDLIHYYHLGLYGGTQFLSEDEIVAKLEALEISTPGYLPT